MKRRFIVLDTEGTAYRLAEMSDGGLRLFTTYGARSYSEFRRVANTGTVFGTLKAARHAIYSELRYMRQFPEHWPEEKVLGWYEKVRIVPVEGAS